ncbi:MAG: response regulator, partial [Ktedonobacteraceae bacterium]|nr:response regulator [Ktedonobacteraceae bacterium]
AQQEFKLGEGVVGQTGLNRQPVQIIRPGSDEAGGFTAKTILGVVLPASFYHLPLLHGNELLGVLGVGSIYTMNEKARNVLNVVAGILAVAISNSRAYQHIQTMANSLAIRSQEQERINAELRFQREEMTTLNSALEESNRARSQFHSTMSHELRTPLTSIIGFSQILLDGTDKAALNQQQRANLERILKNGKHLLVLINDVLDLAKIEAGHMGANDAQVDVRELLTSVVEQTSSIALARNLVLSVEVEEGIDFIESDALKLRQILLNLVSNALKFTEKGGVTVSAKCVLSTDKEAEHIALAVHDTGMGIPADIQEHVFEAFYQADGSSTRKFGGTGLGLSIVSQLTALLGGKIEVKSAAGQGSTFTLLLPSKATHLEQEIPRLHQAQEEVLPLPPASQELPPEILHELFEISANRETTGEHNNVVLVIDDNPDNVVMIEAALQDTSYTVVGLQDPLQAMDMVRELQPCVITLDVMMPNLNGWQVLHQLKADPATAAIPVIMITALSERTTGYVLGADDYLMKPFKSDILRSTLQRLVPAQQSSSLDSEVASPM